MNFSVHDNHLYAYEVDSKTGTVVFHTEYAYGDPPFERLDVFFEGCVDHFFQNAILPSILCDVEEVAAALMIAKYRSIIDEGHTQSGWPSFWRNTAEGMAQAISDAGCVFFEITSSYGLHGWVLAKACHLRGNS